MRASTSFFTCSPLTVRVIVCLLIVLVSFGSFAGFADGAFDQDAGQIALILHRATQIGGGVAFGSGGLTGGFQHGVVERLADEGLFGILGAHGGGTDVGQANAGGVANIAL